MGRISRRGIYIDSAGGRIHLDMFNNTGVNKTIVFFPGTGAASEFYATFLEALTYQGFNVVGIDPVGHGHSDGKRGDFTVDLLLKNLKDAVSFVKQEFTGKIGVMGSSQGGIVVYYAALEGLNVDAVVAHNAALVYKEFLNIIRHPQIYKKLLPIVNYLINHFPTLKMPTSVYLDWHKVFSNPGMLKVFKRDKLFVGYYTIRAIASLMDYIPETKGLPMPPTMVITGTEDMIISKNISERAFYALKGNFHTYVEIEGATHMLPLEYMSQILPRIVDWFFSRLE